MIDIIKSSNLDKNYTFLFLHGYYDGNGSGRYFNPLFWKYLVTRDKQKS